MMTCFNCIHFQEGVCMHPDDKINSEYYDGAEDTEFAEDCEGYEEENDLVEE